MKDVKFGYHWIWMLPVFYLYEAFYWLKKRFNKLRLKCKYFTFTSWVIIWAVIWIVFIDPSLHRMLLDISAH